MTKETKQWFKSWFDTPFYHILYKDRDHDEASKFMSKITSYLNIPQNAEILDLACGKGRHSLQLNKIGFKVTGIDLSQKSIEYAKQFENENLHFEVHDMSTPYHKQFDAVFNLFTSFGYFDNEEDNQNTINAIKKNLKEHGIGVIDFLNTDYVVSTIVPYEEKTIEGIRFKINRYIKENYIVKDIAFSHDNKNYNFQERVKAFRINDFKNMLDNANLTLLDTFGDYDLNAYKTFESPRLIMIFM